MNNDVTTKLETLRQMIDSSSRIVFFGGAGVSTESGIPDFRSQDGLYSQEWDYPPEQIISHSFFVSNPEEFYRFYRAKLLLDGVQPNPAHFALAKWEKEGKLSAVVTQNIDGLHQAAGSRQVFELHGSIHRNFCTKCQSPSPTSAIAGTTGIPRCTKEGCGGILKPDVVLYEEGLDNAVLEGATNAISRADMLIIGGTSLVVYPAAGLVQYFRGDRLVVINRDATSENHRASLVLTEKIGEVFSHFL
jgi:NAD-dependent deacetylase